MAQQDNDSTYRLSLDEGSPLWDRREVAESRLVALSDGLLVIDSEGRIVLANPAAARILGVEMDKFATHGWAELFLEDDKNADFNQTIITVVQENVEHSNRRVSYTRPDGRVSELVVTTIVMRDGQKNSRDVQAVLIVINDLTDIVQMHRRESQLLQRSKLLVQEKAEGLDRLARAVAHEIRNPVTSIGGLANRLLSLVNPYGREAQYLRRMLESTQRLESVVREVRDYADLPAPRLRPTDLGAWLKTQAAILETEAQAGGVSFQSHGGVGHVNETHVRMDPEMIERIINVLMRNAMEAMPSGGLLRLGLRVDEECAYITLCDNGRGIDPGDLPYLFDPFYSTKADAVGMSLANAKRIALEHHGDLTAESRPGRGATFTLRLPLSEPCQLGEVGQEARPPELK